VVRIALAVTLTIGAGLLTADAAGGQEQGAAGASPAVSADHVTEGLRRPELVIPQVPIQEPTFRSGVTGKLETPLDVIRRELREEAKLRPWQGGYYMPGQSTGSTPGLIAQVDVWPALMSLVTRIKTIRREHAEADARQMVQEELSAFCAQHDCSEAAALPIDEGIIMPR
jgi:hypothetical protein